MRVLSLEEMELVSGAGHKKPKSCSGVGSGSSSKAGSSKASSMRKCKTGSSSGGGSSSGKKGNCPPCVSEPL
jgi:hypothetical protein